MIDECLIAEFRIEGDDCPLAEASAAVDTSITSPPPLLRSDGNVLLRFGTPRSDALAATLDADNRIRYLHRSKTDERDNYRCLSMHPCVVHELMDAGFMVESLTYERGSAVLTGAVIGQKILKSVMETAGETVGIRLERVFSLQSDEDPSIARQWDMTPRQEEALRRAWELGYFSVPRDVTASEVAESIGVSKTAFLERLHRAQNSLFAQLFISPHSDKM